jgi:hypothetical protein
VYWPLDRIGDRSDMTDYWASERLQSRLILCPLFCEAQQVKYVALYGGNGGRKP